MGLFPLIGLVFIGPLQLVDSFPSVFSLLLFVLSGTYLDLELFVLVLFPAHPSPTIFHFLFVLLSGGVPQFCSQLFHLFLPLYF